MKAQQWAGTDVIRVCDTCPDSYIINASTEVFSFLLTVLTMLLKFFFCIL